MADLIANYLDRLTLKGFSDNTIAAYRQDLRQAEKALGCKLEQAEGEDLEAFVASLQRKGMKGTTIRRKQASLRGFFEHVRRRKVRDDDPTVGFEAPKLEKRVPIFLNAGQVEAMLAVLDTSSPAGAREAAIIACFYFTGMRAGELVALNVEDLLFGERQLRVFGKGKKERWLPLGEKLAAYLQAWLAFHPTRAGALFIRLHGQPGRIGYDTVAATAKRVFGRAGLAGRKFGCHKLRHTFATRLVNRKVSIDKIQKLLGHQSIETTTRYAHTELGAELVDQVEGAL